MVREGVKAGAAWYIYSIRDLIKELKDVHRMDNVPGVISTGAAAFTDVTLGQRADRRVGVSAVISPHYNGNI